MEAVIIGLVLAVYFFPGIVASCRKHHQENAIYVMNIFLGWTGIGWVAALIWAATATEKQQEDAQSVAVETEAPLAAKDCPQCAETVKAAAQICRFCNYDFTNTQPVLINPPPA